MKKILALAILSMICIVSHAQEFGNEWIEANKSYIKLTALSGDGLYRLNFAQISSLIDAGVDAKTLKVLFRGRQIPITVVGEEDGSFSGSDYIEFYAVSNDAHLDKLLYENPKDHTHPYAVMYDNKTYFFLTWGGEQGQRIGTQNLGSSEAFEPFVWGETIVPIDEELTAGQELAGQYGRWVTYSHFFSNKGRTSRALANNASRAFGLNFPGFLASAPVNPSIEALLVGKRPHTSSFSISIANTVVGSASFLGWTNYLHHQDIGKSFLTGSTLTLTLSNTSSTASTPIAISYLKLRYPRATSDLNTARQFFYTQAGTSVQRFNFSSSRQELRFFDVTDVYQVRRLASQFESGSHIFAIASPSGSKVMAVSDWLTFSAIEKVNFPTLNTKANYLIVTEARLRLPFQDSVGVVDRYAQYRSSPNGGGFEVSIANVNDLYNLFTYGEAHPLAIRRYAAYLLQTGKPEYLFLIGQGFKSHYNYEKAKPTSLTWANQHFVPGMGYPESDILLTAGLLPDGSPFEPALATGRLPVQRVEQIHDYLQKVIQHDTSNYLGTGKNHILHLAGGNNPFEIGAISNFMQNSARSASGLYVGADVETITKTTSEAIQSVNITPQVNRGISLLDFYGHGSLTSTQLDFGRPNSTERNYQNQGKYFGLMLWGCAGGDVFDYSPGILTDWVLAKNRGAIFGYAHSSQGFLVDLGRMSNDLYASYFADSAAYKLPFGMFLKNWNSRYYKNSASMLGRAALQQFILVGDPAVKLLPNTGVDYDISQARVKFITEAKLPLTAYLDSFQIELPIKNNANFHHKTFSVLVERKFGDGTTKIYPKIDVQPFVKESKVLLSIAQTLSEKERAVGVNNFRFVVDPDTLIAELREDNNTISTSMVFPKGSLSTVSPSNFSIVNSPKVTLYCVDNDLRATEKNYLFEVDTTDSFDSPLKKTYLKPAYYKITQDILLEVPDSTVVYWRVRQADGSEQDWELRSFTYIQDGPSGWSQSHFPQFKSVETQGAIVRSDSRRDWRFFSRDVNMEVRSLGFRHPDSMGYYVKIDGITYFEANAAERCAEDAFAFAAIDPKTYKPYSPYRNHWFWNNLFCGNTSDFSYFHNDYLLGNWGGQINSYIFKQYYDRYKEGDIIIALSTLNYYHADVPSNRYLRHLNLMGIDEAEYLQKAKRGYPFIALSTKGNPQQPAQVIYADPSSEIAPNKQELKATFRLATVVDTSGALVSPLIGPALDWKVLYFDFGQRDNQFERAEVEVWGVDDKGETVLLVKDAQNGMRLDTVVSARQFAYLFLKAKIRDSFDKTPLQLRYWRVLFEQYPEAILTYKTNSDRNQTLMQGQPAYLSFQLQNTSSVAFKDSIVVEHTLEESKSGKSRSFKSKLPALAAGDSVFFDFKPVVGTEFVGEVLVQTFANPFIQPELTFVNNILDDQVWINRDSLNPMLDVVFDGKHIADGDFVSSNPAIDISLWDESEFLFLRDTSYLEVYLSPCPDCEPQKISLAKVRFEQLKSNGVKLGLSPYFEQEGTYRLVVVGYDVSYNSMRYEISFRVQFENEVSYFYAYPNPFSDKIHFDFELRGKENPDQAKIEIFDVVGRKVTELEITDWAQIKIGRNEKIASWDGRNQSGALVPSGMYFYKIKFSHKGKDFHSKPFKPEQNMHQGDGKIILQR
jgi:hypothetical protein